MSTTENIRQETQVKREDAQKPLLEPQKKKGYVHSARSGRPLLGRGHVTCLINHG
ncbi:hypothetical protein [Treponema vincentii]|uniref:hypothetical protein n=1 Tax=Treponema vincentii TaxID=69710 RepID=UPI0020A3B530|nr:hypothetical protein [Treponema vincentii]UTC47716.1 hypothetical protein E4N73_02115 [Treponema vincentii]